MRRTPNLLRLVCFRAPIADIINDNLAVYMPLAPYDLICGNLLRTELICDGKVGNEWRRMGGLGLRSRVAMGRWDSPFRMGMLDGDGFLIKIDKNSGRRYVFSARLAIVAKPYFIVADPAFYCRKALKHCRKHPF